MPRPSYPRPQTFVGHLADKTWLGPHTLALAIEPGCAITFLPGQYVSLRLPGSEMNETRAYSLWGHPGEGGPLRTVVRLVEGGKASEWFRRMEVGTALSGMAPLGVFTLREPLPATLHMVATGTGLVPLRSMLVELAVRGALERHDVHLWFGCRHEEDLFALEELNALAQAHSGFHFHPTLSSPGVAWAGARGRVTGHLEAVASAEAPGTAHFYLCGNGRMIRDVRAVLMAAGHERRAVLTEKYFD